MREFQQDLRESDEYCEYFGRGVVLPAVIPDFRKAEYVTDLEMQKLGVDFTVWTKHDDDPPIFVEMKAVNYAEGFMAVERYSSYNHGNPKRNTTGWAFLERQETNTLVYIEKPAHTAYVLDWEQFEQVVAFRKDKWRYTARRATVTNKGANGGIGAITYIPFSHAVEYMTKVSLLSPVYESKQTSVSRIHGTE